MSRAEPNFALAPTVDGARLRCADLSFSYRGQDAALLHAVNLAFPSGAVTALTGRSGSGKSTLMYLLSMLLRPRSGQVVWDGTDLTALSDAQASAWRATTTGFIFQDAMLDPARTVLDNVCEPAVFAGIPRREATVGAYELLGRLDVAHRAHHRPAEISGGQAQRVGICRALLNRPAVVFGDEPTGNVDDTTAEVIWSELAGLARSGSTVVIATHDERLARRCDARVQL